MKKFIEVDKVIVEEKEYKVGDEVVLLRDSMFTKKGSTVSIRRITQLEPSFWLVNERGACSGPFSAKEIEKEVE